MEPEVEQHYREHIRRYKKPLKFGCQAVLVVTLALLFSGMYVWAFLLPIAWLTVFGFLAVNTARRGPVSEDSRSSFVFVEQSARVHSTSPKGAIVFDILLAPYSWFLVWFGKHGKFHRLAKRGKRSVPELIELATNGSEFDQWRAIKLLGAVEAQEAVPLLAELAHSNESHLREAAVLSLRQIDGEGATKELGEVARHTNDDAVWFLATASLRSRSIDANVDLARFTRAWNLLSGRNSFEEGDINEALGDYPLSITEPIIRDLGKKRWTMLYGAFRELGKLRGPGARDLFLEFLDSGEEDKCCCALFGLAELGDRDTLDTVRAFEIHGDARIRGIARLASRKIRDANPS